MTLLPWGLAYRVTSNGTNQLHRNVRADFALQGWLCGNRPSLETHKLESARERHLTYFQLWENAHNIKLAALAICVPSGGISYIHVAV